MSAELNSFIQLIENAKKDLDIHRQGAIKLGCNDMTVNAFKEVVALVFILGDEAKQGELKVNYLNQFQSSIEEILSNLPFRGNSDVSFIDYQSEQWKGDIKRHLKQNSLNIYQQCKKIKFNKYFFEKIGYFENNIVAIGANGSGKTSLSNKFKDYLQNNGIVISAQRILLVPNFVSIANPTLTANELKEYQLMDKTNKLDGGSQVLQQEFGIVLKNLLADNISTGNSYRKKAIESVELGEVIENPETTNLDTTLKIWNSLIEHREINCEDGINITADSGSVKSYPANHMSDGEKVMLYLIAQVLQAPKKGFVVVDEPEMYLHKTILKKLWDILEAERSDCIFIYLTHDLDFATSRITAKKIWIRSFIYPDYWEIDDIPTDEIPEALMLELLGSRKNILFCEGINGSIDEKVYSILFPELTITPVGTCFNVINHTKAFNNLRNVNTKAYGLIDSDHHDAGRLATLKENKIFSFNVAEVENLFLDSDFLAILARQILKNDTDVESIKSEVIKEMEKQKEIQASNYVSTKINYYFANSDVSKGNDLDQLNHNYEEFINKISIVDWYNNRIIELNQMVENSEYESVLSSFNNKGLKTIAQKYLNISDFKDKSLKFLQISREAQQAVAKYFPRELLTLGNN